MELHPGDARLFAEQLESGEFEEPATSYLGDYEPEPMEDGYY